MNIDDRPDKSVESNKQGFLTMLLRGIIQDLVSFLITFVIGTVAGAILCLYLGIPLIFSLLGGVLVMAVYVAWDRL